MRFAILTSVLVLAPPTSVLAQSAVDPMTVSGRVVDVDRRPLSEVSIAAFSNEEHVTDQIFDEAVVETGSDGRFEFELDPTTRLVAFARDGFAAAQRTVSSRSRGELGDIVLPEGIDFRGFVRSSAGAQLSGVRVVARDAMRQKSFLQGIDRSLMFVSRADSDDKGRFRLRCALPTAMQIAFDKDGYRPRELGPVSFGDPLVAALDPAERVRGRLVDAQGEAVAGTVSVSYEVRGVASRAATAADGSFELGLKYRTRYRVSARSSELVDGARLGGESEILDGAQDAVTVRLERPAARATRELIVRAVDKASGDAVSTFEAAVRWQSADQLPHMLPWIEQQLELSKRKSSPAGELALSGPQPGGPLTAAIRLSAEGFATLISTDVSWEDDAAQTQEVVLELDPEAVVTGRVVDSATGEPVAGARVGERPVVQNDLRGVIFTGANPGQAFETVRTDELGRFTIRGLAKGRYTIHATDPSRPPAAPADIELETGQRREGLEIKMPRGATLDGRLVGARAAGGWRVHAQPANGSRLIQTSAGATIGVVPGVPVGEDGGFVVEGLADGNYELQLWIPPDPRRGPAQTIPLGSLRVDGEDQKKEIDIERKVPGELRGRIRMKGSPIPGQRLIVAADPLLPRRTRAPFSFVRGPFVLAERDGSFGLALAPGDYDVRVLDLDTGVEFWRCEEPLTIEPSTKLELEIEFEVIKAIVGLEPVSDDGRWVADRLDVVTESAWAVGANVAFAGSTTDRGMGIDLRDAPSEVVLFVPDADITLNVWSRNPLAQTRGRAPLASFDFVAASGRINEWTIRIPEPIELGR